MRQGFKYNQFIWEVTPGRTSRERGKKENKDFPGGLGVKTLGSQCRGPGVQSLVRELDSTSCN